MNSLSLFLYLADIANSFNAVAIIFIVISMSILIALRILVAMARAEPYPDISKEDAKQRVAFIHTMTKKLIPSWVVLAFFVVLAPSQQTMYLIAASEIGESAIDLPAMHNIYDKLDRYLEMKITEMVRKKK